MNSVRPKNLVFLSGWSYDANIWQDLESQLPTPIRCLALPEIKHQGESLFNTLDYIVAELDKFIIHDSTLVAWSLGGLIAIYYCYKYPHKIKQLITVCASPKFAAADNWPGLDKSLLDQFYLLSCNNLKYMLQRLSLLALHPFNNKKIFTKLICHQCIHHDQHFSLLEYLNILRNADLRYHLSQLPTPVFHIFGSQDQLVKLTLVEYIIALRPDKNKKIINGASHIPFMTHQQEFINVIRSF